MKKIKYLLWFLVFWFWLLFNQSFWIDLELIDNPSESQYLIEFSTRSTCSNSVCGILYAYMNYNYKYYVWSILNTYTYWSQPSNCGTEDCSSYEFNRSMTWLDLFYSSTVHYAAWSRFPYTYTYPYWTNINYQTLLCQQQSLGLVYVCPDCFNEVINWPKFKVWTSFYWDYENVKIVNSTESNYIRLLNEFNTWFNISNINFISWSWFPVSSWEYFTPLQVRTNYWRIATPWYSLWRIWSPLGLWFSSVYSYDTSNTWSFSYNNLQFRTYYDLVIVPLKLMAANNQWILLDSDLSWFYFDGVLVLPDNSYHSWQSLWEYIIAKDPIDTNRILFELYSCINNNVDVVFSWWLSSSCIKLDAWYLTYNWSTDVLPFNDSNTKYSCSDNYPLLCDLTSSRISTTLDSNWIKIGNHIYWFQTDPSVDIKSLLESFWWESASDQINQKLIERCLNDTEFSLSQPVCNWITEQFWNVIALWSWQYMQYSFDNSWNLVIEIIEQAWLFDWYTWTVRVQNENWDWVTNCDDWWCSPSSWSWSPYFQSGILTVDYYDFYSNTWLFFKCPYPYESIFSYWNFNLKLWKFDILLPINCMISAFKHWKSFDAFDNVWLFDFWPLMQWTTQQHRILFRFFDFILILWYVLFFSLIYKRFK